MYEQLEGVGKALHCTFSVFEAMDVYEEVV